MSGLDTAARAALLSLALAVPALAAQNGEATFLRSVDRRNTAYRVTGDLVHYTGTHVAYTCDVDNVVKPGLVLGQCGSEAEPMDLFIHMSTGRVHNGDRLRVLGIMEPPATWTDLTGHTVYYAFLKAVFVDHVR